MANLTVFLWNTAFANTWGLFVILGVVVLAIGAAFFLVARKRPVKTQPLSDEIIEEIIRNLGGVANISKVSQDGARMKFEIVDLNLCHLEDLRLNGAVGVFVTDHAVKFILANKADRLIEQINEIKKGVKQ